MDIAYFNKNFPAAGARKYHIQSGGAVKSKAAFAAFLGLLIGAVNGIFGAGGGMLAVPALTFALGYDVKRAHATAILVILPLCVISSVMYSLRASFDFSVVLPTSLGVFAGGVVGALLLKKLPTEWLSFIFYGLMLLSGIKMLFPSS